MCRQLNITLNVSYTTQLFLNYKNMTDEANIHNVFNSVFQNELQSLIDDVYSIRDFHFMNASLWGFNQSEYSIIWNLPLPCHHVIIAAILSCIDHLTSAISHRDLRTPFLC